MTAAPGAPAGRPLADLLVVSLEQAVAAPFATRQLADLGARVIKVERPGHGDFARDYDKTVHGQSSYFVWLNRGKQSIELDLKAADDRALLGRIVERADVLVQNLAPGAAARLGLDAATLRSQRPELIHCSVSGYGQDGPYQAKKAYDLLVQCEAGLLEATGTPDVPVKVGVSIADIAAGMYACSGVLAALYERQRTGVGASIEVSMLDALADWMTPTAYFAAYGGRPLARTGARHASIAPYGPYRASDAVVFLGVQNDREWASLCRQVLGREELVGDPRFVHNPERVAHDDQITELLEAHFARLPAAELQDLLDAAGIANARMRRPADLFEHPQLTARQRWGPVHTPNGPVQALLPPITADGWTPVLAGLPALGQHNAALRAEFTPRPASPAIAGEP